MKSTIFGLLCLLITGSAAAQDKDDSTGAMNKSRPVFFNELKDTETLCMATCPTNMDSVFGLKLICGNFDAAAYQNNCSNISSDQPVEYCNCFKGECTKFQVSCQQTGRICAVEVLDSKLAPSSCECNGNSCEPPAGNFTDSLCYMRKVPSTKVCEIERTVAFSSGKTYQISCKANESKCVSEGVLIRNEATTPNLSLPKPGELK